MAMVLLPSPYGEGYTFQSVRSTDITVTVASAPCPRCNATGEELLFMSFHTCEVCAGAKRVTQIAADAEIARRESERVS